MPTPRKATADTPGEDRWQSALADVFGAAVGWTSVTFTEPGPLGIALDELKGLGKADPVARAETELMQVKISKVTATSPAASGGLVASMRLVMVGKDPVLSYDEVILRVRQERPITLVFAAGEPLPPDDEDTRYVHHGLMSTP